VKQLQAAPWADPARLVLAGYSQGGIAAALYDGPEFKARIIIAWPCQLRSSGPSGPETGVRGEGPVVLVFYRGAWCPYCNLQLRAFQAALADINAAGAGSAALPPCATIGRSPALPPGRPWSAPPARVSREARRSR